MKILVDTHACLWWTGTPSRLSPVAFKALEDRDNDVFISVASLWEIGIKHALGKLKLPLALSEFERQLRAVNDVSFLPIDTRHVHTLTRLPAIHKDPFDRMLVAQALSDELVILTCDPAIQQYPAETLW